MNKFRIDFITGLEELKLRKTDVANSLEMTMPTLNSKVKEPEKLTLKDLSNLLGLGFRINILKILEEIKKKENEKQQVRQVEQPMEEIRSY